VEIEMRNTTTLLVAALIAAGVLTASAQAENFFVGLLRGSQWQPPKCTAPEVLTQVKDRSGKIMFRCMKPASR
jgi:hypothetical protein